MGDSTSAGFGSSAGGFSCRSWTDLLAESLAENAPFMRYLNVARNGASVDDVLRLQSPLIAELRPDLVSVTVGANDARSRRWDPAAFAVGFKEIVEPITASGAQVITATYPDITEAITNTGRKVPVFWRSVVARLHEVDEVIRSVSADTGALLLDLEHSEAATDPRYLSWDSAHPNALGYRMTAEAALDLLRHYC